MSSIVLMRILESAPDRYDAGMRVLRLGAVPRAHRAVAAAAVWRPQTRVLEIGCGTGAVTALLADAGAEVVAFDQSPEMIDRARKRLEGHRIEGHGLEGASQDRVTFEDSTAAEMDRYPQQSFDAVVASLCFSEMSASERRYVLSQVRRVLKPDGRFVICDEVEPKKRWQKIAHAAVRIPAGLLTWVITGTTPHALVDPCGELRSAGLCIRSEERSGLGTLAVIVAERAA